VAGLLSVGVEAVIAEARSFAAIGQWAADADPEVLSELGAARGPAEESAFRRAFALVSADALDRILGFWLWIRAAQVGGRLVIAIDSKTVRGAKDKDGRPHTWSRTWPTASTRSSARSRWTRGATRSPAVRELLKAFADLAGAVLTIDAMHAQHDTAQLILARHADYVMTVKANMPTLYKQPKSCRWSATSPTKRTSP
jgi:hypothetical protein